MNPQDFSDGKNGRLIRSPSGYWAFLPTPLTQKIQVDTKVTVALSLADRKVGELNGLCHRLPNPQLLSGAYVLREAEKSSRIEGTESTVSELYLFEIEPEEAAKPEDIREVLNYVRALNYGLSRRKSLPLSLRFVREIHGKLMEGVRGQEKQPGEFRTSQNWIGGSRLENARYVPPPPDDMKSALDALEKFLHRTDPQGLPPLLECAMIHYQFEAIHPFNDGNGRIGRLLIILLCIEREILAHPLLYLSAFFEKHRIRYFEHLLAVSQHGAWEDWYLFFLEGVREQAEDAARRAVRILDLQSRYAMLKLTLTSRRMCELLFKNPYISSSVAQEKLSVSNPAANKSIQQLVDLQVLTPYLPTRKRGQRYVAKEILDAFTVET